MHRELVFDDEECPWPVVTERVTCANGSMQFAMAPHSVTPPAACCDRFRTDPWRPTMAVRNVASPRSRASAARAETRLGLDAQRTNLGRTRDVRPYCALAGPSYRRDMTDQRAPETPATGPGMVSFNGTDCDVARHTRTLGSVATEIAGRKVPAAG